MPYITLPLVCKCKCSDRSVTGHKKENMKRPASGTKSSKKPKTMVAKKTVKSFGAPSKSLRLYKTGFPKQMFITHKYTQTSSLQWTTLMLISSIGTLESIVCTIPISP